MRLFLWGLLLLLMPRVGNAQRLDPDYCWSCPDKAYHFAAGAALDLAIRPFIRTELRHPMGRILTVCFIGAVWEGIQSLENQVEHRAGPGYGFGVADLMATCLGATVMDGLVLVGQRVLR